VAIGDQGVDGRIADTDIRAGRPATGEPVRGNAAWGTAPALPGTPGWPQGRRCHG
jgi:hypothetical protein